MHRLYCKMFLRLIYELLGGRLRVGIGLAICYLLVFSCRFSIPGLFYRFCIPTFFVIGYLLNSLKACKNSFCWVLIVSLYFVTRLSTLFMYRITVATIAANAVSITTRKVPLSDEVSFDRAFPVSFITHLSTIFFNIIYIKNKRAKSPIL